MHLKEFILFLEVAHSQYIFIKLATILKKMSLYFTEKIHLFNCLMLLTVFFFSTTAYAQDGFLFTVDGKIDAGELGFTLPHEHVMSNFGADSEIISQYDEAALMVQVVPYLQKLKSLGVASVFDCTTAYFGRNVSLLQRLSKESGIQILTNTGFYGAANDRYVPPWAQDASAAEIADTWIAEFENGIDGTIIKPSFIKLAFDNGTPSKIDLKLFEAGIVTHKKTGLTMAVHTGNNREAVKQQLDLLTTYKVSPEAWIWVHANKAQDMNLLLETAQKGAWISLDGINSSNIMEYIDFINRFRKENLLDKILLSHDGNSFPRGGEIREYHALSELLIPKLLELGYSKNEIHLLTIENPKNAFSIRKRTF